MCFAIVLFLHSPFQKYTATDSNKVILHYICLPPLKYSIYQKDVVFWPFLIIDFLPSFSKVSSKIDTILDPHRPGLHGIFHLILNVQCK